MGSFILRTIAQRDDNRQLPRPSGTTIHLVQAARLRFIAVRFGGGVGRACKASAAEEPLLSSAGSVHLRKGRAGVRHFRLHYSGRTYRAMPRGKRLILLAGPIIALRMRRNWVRNTRCN
ncbi:hypothetical protein [Xanthomonas cannabis]|uniref:hypothetical protein n=1 Tax=Xanthomonas cannabis TaxID=1885674 RepID=UPI001112872B|nr:hypothetical protein [Xanthomonas cannabis]